MSAFHSLNLLEIYEDLSSLAWTELNDKTVKNI